MDSTVNFKLRRQRIIAYAVVLHCKTSIFLEAVQIRAMDALRVLKSQFTSASDIVQTYHC